MNITIQRIKRKQIFLSLCSFAMLWGLSINLNAQVAIGLTEKPVDGALLQLKDIEGVTDGAQNANKGMNMPRVELTALNTLIISGEDYNSEALKHVGLIVFNMKEDQSKNLYKAPYLWDGERWGLIYDKDWVDAPRSLYFYKSAWMPKELPVTGFVDNIDRNVNIDIHADVSGTVDLNGAGAIFPASPQLQVDGEEKYTFQPVENTSGEIRSTDVTFTASRSGTIGTASRTTRVVHYPYEFPIHVEPSILPATLINNGIGAASIWSVADWKISLAQPADHDTQSMLATNLTPGDEFRGEKPLMLNVNQNPTWNEKEIKINVESVGADGKHYEDLAPQTLTVKQKANVPSIVISDPANKILDFGLQTTGSKNVIISSNARWTATGDPNIAEVIGSNAILGGTQHGINSPAVPINTTIALPVSTTGTNAKAGTVYNSNITFTTADHGTASAVSSTLAVRKTIPLVFETSSLSGTTAFGPDGGSVTVNIARTNTNWYARILNTASVNSQTVTGLTASSLTLAVPQNTGGSQAMYTVQVSSDNVSWYNVAGSITVAPRTLAITVVSPASGSFLSFDGCRISFKVIANYAGTGSINIPGVGSFFIQIHIGETTVNTYNMGVNNDKENNASISFRYADPAGTVHAIASYTQYRRLATNTTYGYFLSTSNLSDLGATKLSNPAGYFVTENTDCIYSSVTLSCAWDGNQYKGQSWNPKTGSVTTFYTDTCGGTIIGTSSVYHVPSSVLKTQ